MEITSNPPQTGGIWNVGMMGDWNDGEKWRKTIKAFKPNIPIFQYFD
jgi:hypothetical protein